MRLETKVWSIVFTAIFFSAQGTSAAPAVSYTDTVFAGNEIGVPGSVRGWVFNVVSPTGIDITDLGVYDRDANGLGESHDVGIWNSSGTMLASGTVPAGTAAPLDVNGRFRIVDITDVHLPIASNYVIGAFYSNLVDGFDSQVSGMVTHPSILYVDKRFQTNVASLQLPTVPFTQLPGYFGPSFEIRVPEPATATLVLLGAIGVLPVLRLCQKRYR